MSVGRAPFVVLGFRTTHAALEAESVLRRAGLDVVPVPTPRGIGHSSGIAMRIPPGQVSLALDALAARAPQLMGRAEMSEG
ncbi:DUF3343 domain-containing protein, partial [bacterium]|nr:DUF3343 domain-containing protein [bacterium]